MRGLPGRRPVIDGTVAGPREGSVTSGTGPRRTCRLFQAAEIRRVASAA